MENKGKLKFIENKEYQICSSLLRSLAAMIDYTIIFFIFILISLFFKSYIYSFIDLKINSLVGENINNLNMYSDNLNEVDLIAGIKQSIGIFMSEFKTIFYILILMYISFWGMVVSFIFIGETPGSRLLKLKIFDVDVRTRGAETSQRIIRVLIYLADFFFLFGIGTLYSLFNKEQRGVAEIISKTIVLRRIN